MSQGGGGLSCPASELRFSGMLTPQHLRQSCTYREVAEEVPVSQASPPLTTLRPLGLWLSPGKGMGRGEPCCYHGSCGKERSGGSATKLSLIKKSLDNLRVPTFNSRTRLITASTQDPAALTLTAKSILSGPERSSVVPESRPPGSPSDYVLSIHNKPSSPLPLPPGPLEGSCAARGERRGKEGPPSHRASSLPDSQAVTSLAGDALDRTEKKHSNKGETRLLGVHRRVRGGRGGRATGD